MNWEYSVDRHNDNTISDLCVARARIEYLEQDVSCVLHLFYCFLVCIFTFAPPRLADDMRRVLHAKILQLPQGCPIGKRLIALDKQFGGLLEPKGIWLARWFYDPRGKPNGA